jgi:Ca2+-dependent lipid-binding protein
LQFTIASLISSNVSTAGFNVVSARQDKLKPMALLLKVICAAGLRAGDTNGKSDPYCRIFVEQVSA